MKLALISNVLPPSESSHAVIIRRLLADLDPESYCLLSGRKYADDGGPGYSGRLTGRYYHLRPGPQLTRGYRFGMSAVREGINTALTSTINVLLRAAQIRAVVRKERCDAIVVCTGGEEALDLPAGCLAAAMVGARFYPYLLDQYSHMLAFILGTVWLRHLEPWMMRSAASVIAPNEFLAETLRSRYGLEPVVIHNPCDLRDYGCAAQVDGGVVYTGAFSPFQHGPLRNLLAAIESLGRPGLMAHVYTAQPPLFFERAGIRGPLVHHEHLPVSAMPGVQQRANVLFLPLTFDPGLQYVVRNAAPGKIGEYLAARRPILVHAPEDSFVSWYFRTHECGVVVDQDDPRLVAQALERLLDDPAYAEKLCTNAWRRAQADFSLDRARATFAETVGLSTAASR